MKQVKERIVKLLKVDFLVGENALKNWIMILFGLFLCIIMIYSAHLFEQKVHTISKLTDEVQDLSSEFVDVRSQLQRVKLESSVLKSLKDSGLKQSETPPNKIKVIVKQ
ncbi:MAG: FtsL-like putative cell division protein [Capnocytophaga sp.]|nr:FtsL-like putative cell division protein [Capnocytophaga sp.]